MNKFSFQFLVVVMISIFVIIQSCKKNDDVKPQTPIINGFTPDAGLVGSSVTITGNFFSSDLSKDIVTIGGVSAVVNEATNAQLKITVPPGAASGKIMVSINGMTATSASDFTVTASAGLQTITSFAPTSAVVGATITIKGTNFDPTPANNIVKFNGVTATVNIATATQLTVTVPASATSGKITVGASTSAIDFTVIAGSLVIPTVTDFTPATATADSYIVINGTNFSATAINNAVKFNGIDATVYAASTTQLLVTVPQGATTGLITVGVNGATGNSTSNFALLKPTWRVKEQLEVKTDIKTVYIYNSSNVLTQAQVFQASKDTNPSSATDFYYGATGKLDSAKSGAAGQTNFYTISVYQYANGLLQTWTYSDETKGVKKFKLTRMSTYQNGVATKDVVTYPDNTTSEVDYSYMILNGDPEIIFHYVNTNSDNTTTYYLNALTPDPTIHFNLEKDAVNGLNSKYGYNTTYTTDANGNISVINYNFPNLPTANYSLMYTYELIP